MRARNKSAQGALAHGSSTCLLLSFLQGQMVGRFSETVLLLHDNLVCLAQESNLLLTPGPAGKTGLLDQFGDYFLLQLLWNATGAQAERSGLVEYHQVPALVLQADRVRSNPQRFFKHTDKFLKCRGRVAGVIGHDVPSLLVAAAGLACSTLA